MSIWSKLFSSNQKSSKTSNFKEIVKPEQVRLKICASCQQMTNFDNQRCPNCGSLSFSSIPVTKDHARNSPGSPSNAVPSGSRAPDSKERPIAGSVHRNQKFLKLHDQNLISDESNNRLSAVKRIGTSILIISKEDILKRNFSTLLFHITSVSLPQIKAGDKNYSKTVISIDGYNNDARPLWKIPEVVKWFEGLHRRHPYIPLFLSSGSVQLYFLILKPIAFRVLPPEYRGMNDLVGLLAHTMAERNKYFIAILGGDYERCQPILINADKLVSDAVTKLIQGVQEPF
jgi:hypothetical protein